MNKSRTIRQQLAALTFQFLISAGLVLFLISYNTSVSIAEEQLASFADPQININVIETKKNNLDVIQLRVQSKKLTSSSLFSLENPSRIVLDLTGPNIKKNRTFNLKHGLISALRIGAHPEKTRLVIDIKSETIPAYQWNESGTTATLTINSSGTPVTSKEELVKEPSAKNTDIVISEIIPEKTLKPSPTVVDEVLGIESDKIEELISKQPKPTSTPKKTETPEPTPTQTATATNTPAATETAKIVATIEAEPADGPVAQTTPKAEEKTEAATHPSVKVAEPDGMQLVEDVRFEYTENSLPTIKIILKNRPQFELIKQDEKTYKLVLKDSKINRAALRLPQFPPHDFVGFTYFAPEENDSLVEFTIGVERNVRITASPNESEIWIRTAQDGKVITKSPPFKK